MARPLSSECRPHCHLGTHTHWTTPPLLSSTHCSFAEHGGLHPGPEKAACGTENRIECTLTPLSPPLRSCTCKASLSCWCFPRMISARLLRLGFSPFVAAARAATFFFFAMVSHSFILSGLQPALAVTVSLAITGSLPSEINCSPTFSRGCAVISPGTLIVM